MNAAATAMPYAESTGRFIDAEAGEDERTWALFTHLIGLIAVIDMGVIALIGTLVMWRVKHASSPFLDDHGREAVNFQLSMWAYVIGGVVLGVLFSIVTFGIGAVLVVPLGALGGLALIILRIWGSVAGALAANRGEYYRYPMCIRFIAPSAA